MTGRERDAQPAEVGLLMRPGWARVITGTLLACLLCGAQGVGAQEPAADRASAAPTVTATAPATSAAGPVGVEGREDSPAPSSAAPAASAPPPVPTPAAPPVPTTWRAVEALGAPSWFWIGLEQRLRFEHLEHDFRAAATGDARALSLRTLLALELRFTPLLVGVELQDARAYATSETLLGTNIVNPFELLRVYVGARTQDVLAPGDRLAVTAGRMTLDVGSRRLVARNEFRNTINAFTGVDVTWTSPDQHLVRAFAVMPVLRRPSDAPALRDNEVAFDHENPDALLWGLFSGSAALGPALRLETYVLGLHERDSGRAPSANRRMVTGGVRLLRAPAPGQLDGQVEAMVQLGRSRASAAATDVRDLVHRAGSLHLSAGYRFDIPGAPRLALQYDFASGDRDPDDGVNGRFDPLFAARRFEFGPTAFYGAIARSNLHSPGARLELAPHADVELLLAYRAVALASARDAWTTAAVRDPSGQSGRFVGHQLESRVRWHMLRRNLALELGGACLIHGDFVERALDTPAPNALYVYSQLTGTL